MLSQGDYLRMGGDPNRWQEYYMLAQRGRVSSDMLPDFGVNTNPVATEAPSIVEPTHYAAASNDAVYDEEGPIPDYPNDYGSQFPDASVGDDMGYYDDPTGVSVPDANADRSTWEEYWNDSGVDPRMWEDTAGTPIDWGTYHEYEQGWDSLNNPWTFPDTGDAPTGGGGGGSYIPTPTTQEPVHHSPEPNPPYIEPTPTPTTQEPTQTYPEPNPPYIEPTEPSPPRGVDPGQDPNQYVPPTNNTPVTSGPTEPAPIAPPSETIDNTPPQRGEIPGEPDLTPVTPNEPVTPTTPTDPTPVTPPSETLDPPAENPVTNPDDPIGDPSDDPTGDTGGGTEEDPWEGPTREDWDNEWNNFVNNFQPQQYEPERNMPDSVHITGAFDQNPVRRFFGDGPDPFGGQYARNYRQEIGNTLGAQLDLMPTLHGEESKWQPDWLDLQQGNLDQSMFGANGGVGQVTGAAGQFQGATEGFNTSERASALQDVQDLLPQYNAIRDATNPNGSATRELIAQQQTNNAFTPVGDPRAVGSGLSTDLYRRAQEGLNQTLSDRQVRDIQQGVREAYGDRGLSRSDAAVSDEVEARLRADMNLQDRARNFAQGVEASNTARHFGNVANQMQTDQFNAQGGLSGTTADRNFLLGSGQYYDQSAGNAFSDITGLRSNALPYGMQQYGMQQQINQQAGPRYFDPHAPYAQSIYQGNQNTQLGLDMAANNADSELWGNIIGAGGNVASSMAQDVDWGGVLGGVGDFVGNIWGGLFGG